MITMEPKLRELFDFLKNNREYNKKLQENYYKSIIMPNDNVVDKVISLIYTIANTQSQPRIDLLAPFYKKILEKKNELETFKGLITLIRQKEETPLNYNALFNSLKDQPGLGPKTSALFTKTIFHLHNNQYSQELKIWDDAPNEIHVADELYLPVDIVITNIFNQLDKEIKWDFNRVNKKIKELYKGAEIEIWDDLWFWGFITQNGSGNKRTFEWNENKYWTLKDSDKDPVAINKINEKANEFLDIIDMVPVNKTDLK